MTAVVYNFCGHRAVIEDQIDAVLDQHTNLNYYGFDLELKPYDVQLQRGRDKMLGYEFTELVQLCIECINKSIDPNSAHSSIDIVEVVRDWLIQEKGYCRVNVELHGAVIVAAIILGWSPVGLSPVVSFCELERRAQR